MLEIERTCRNCGKVFKPYYGRQIYCCESCRLTVERTKRREQRNLESSLKIADNNGRLLSNKTHLSISHAALFLNVSRPTIYKRIEAGELHPIKLGKRTIRIPVHELLSESELVMETKIGDFSITIKLDDVLLRYDTNRSDFYKTIAEHNIAVRKRRNVAYYPQKTLDKFLRLRGSFNPSEWYTMEEVIESSGYSRKIINSVCRKANIPRTKKDGVLYISKRWDNHRYCKEDLEKNYMTHKQAILHYRIGNDKFYNFVNESGIQRHRDGNLVYFKKSDLDKLFKKK